MKTDLNESGVLYFPFSRCIDLAALKQMLLLFDSVTFCDPVDDEAWRQHLFVQMEREDQKFQMYRDLGEAIPTLLREGAVRTIDPGTVEAVQDSVTTDAILADIIDSDWAKLASEPLKYG